MSLTKVTYSMIEGATINALDYGVDPTGSADSTIAMQAAIDAAQISYTELYVPPGQYKISDTLTTSSDYPLRLNGAVMGIFDGMVLEDIGTVFNFTATSKTLFLLNTGNDNDYQFSNFIVNNTSGGSAEIAFAGTPVHCKFSNITGFKFEHLFKFEKSVYLSFERIYAQDCDYGIDCYQFTGTAPYVLNINYFNNVISVKDCTVANCVVGFRFAGANINIDNCDCSSYSVAGVVFGRTDLPLTTANIGLLYTEGSSATAVMASNTQGVFNTIYLGGSDTVGVLAVTSNLNIGNLVSNGLIATGVDNYGSTVQISNTSGAITTIFTNHIAGVNGITRQINKENTKTADYTLTAGQSETIVVESVPNRRWVFNVYGSDNGVSNFSFQSILAGNAIYTTGTIPSNLTVTPLIDINGNYNLKIQNTASSAYTFVVKVDYCLGYYNLPTNI